MECLAYPVITADRAWLSSLRSPKGLKKSTFTEICVVSFFEELQYQLMFQGSSGSPSHAV